MQHAALKRMRRKLELLKLDNATKPIAYDIEELLALLTIVEKSE